MPGNYYQNILYPVQDRILEIIGDLPVHFYITGGTALSRAYLNHRYSDDLVFFVNDTKDFRPQVELIIEELKKNQMAVEIPVADTHFVRAFIKHGSITVKTDFVNDVPFRHGNPVKTDFFLKTDTVLNILSNELSALTREEPKDIVDIVFICRNTSFNWQEIVGHARQKDLWVNPVETARILDRFHVSKLAEIRWVARPPSAKQFKNDLKTTIRDILLGNDNSLCSDHANPVD